MGIMDHNRTWHFQTSASPAECVGAFAACLSGRRGAIVGTAWSVATSGDAGSRRAVATYQGRAGMAGAITMLSGRATQEQEAAVGSQLTFTATTGPDGTTTCTMAMTRVAKLFLFFTADARFFRSAMNRVARQLRDRDPALELVKN